MKKIDLIKQDILNGKPIIVVDDYDREFEGDIVIAAEKASMYNLTFAMKHAKGLMCLPCTQERIDRLDIPMMRTNKMDKFGTPFTVSIDGVDGVTTGMSVHDRLKTISVFLSNHSKPHELSQPGHLFPLRAQSNLLKDRRGHTEASIELMKLCGLEQVAVIIEIMNEDGTMTKGDQLTNYSKIYNLNIISVDEIYDAIYNESV